MTGSQYPRFTPDPPLYQRVAAHLFGSLKVGVDSARSVPIYLWKCPKGLWIQDYPHGFDRYFSCPFNYGQKVTCQSCSGRPIEENP